MKDKIITALAVAVWATLAGFVLFGQLIISLFDWVIRAEWPKPLNDTDVVDILQGDDMTQNIEDDLFGRVN